MTLDNDRHAMIKESAVDRDDSLTFISVVGDSWRDAFKDSISAPSALLTLALLVGVTGELV